MGEKYEISNSQNWANGKTSQQNGIGTHDIALTESNGKPHLERTVSEVEKDSRDREPLRFCRWITERPKTWFGK